VGELKENNEGNPFYTLLLAEMHRDGRNLIGKEEAASGPPGSGYAVAGRGQSTAVSAMALCFVNILRPRCCTTRGEQGTHGLAGVAPWCAGGLWRRLLSGEAAGGGRIGRVAAGLHQEAAALQGPCARITGAREQRRRRRDGEGGRGAPLERTQGKSLAAAGLLASL
jgi:hypothetical protein